MGEFDKLIEEIAQALNLKMPNLGDTPYKKYDKGVEPPMPSKKRNENDHSKISGKYFKGLDNTSNKVVSDQDKNQNTRKGSFKRSLNQTAIPHSRIVSQKDFDRMFDAGERSLNFADDGEWKTLNSKTGEYQARRLADGRIKIRKTRLQRSVPPTQ